MTEATPEQIVAFLMGGKAMSGRDHYSPIGYGTPMPDIIERLRGRLPYEEYSWDIAQEAAAEIERLRALLQQAIECCRSSAGAEERNNFIRDARRALEP